MSSCFQRAPSRFVLTPGWAVCAMHDGEWMPGIQEDDQRLKEYVKLKISTLKI